MVRKVTVSEGLWVHTLYEVRKHKREDIELDKVLCAKT
jgi:hypothetical protein